jgi:hypothetical protein
MKEKEELCAVCGQPAKDCVCCEPCGHICPRDLGEPYCPICLPDPEAS